MNANPKFDRSLKELLRVIAVRCHGKTVVLGCGEGYLAKALEDCQLNAVGVNAGRPKTPAAHWQHLGMPPLYGNPGELKIPQEGFHTVVLAEVLEHVPQDTGAEILFQAWHLLRPGGRLIVSVPNEDCIPHPHHIQQFNRRSLKQLLQSLGKPQLVTDQPFKWLMMYVNRSF